MGHLSFCTRCVVRMRPCPEGARSLPGPLPARSPRAGAAKPWEGECRSAGIADPCCSLLGCGATTALTARVLLAGSRALGKKDPLGGTAGLSGVKGRWRSG